MQLLATGHQKPSGSRFNYVKYDEHAVRLQNELKALFEQIEQHLEASLSSSGRSKALSLTALEEAYMWVGKAIRDDQISRKGTAEEQPERKDG